MSELRINRHVPDPAHRQPDEFVLFARSGAKPSSATAEPPPHKPGRGPADPVARLEHCIGLQAMAISLIEGERRAPLAPAGMGLLPLLRQTIRYQRTTAMDFRSLQAEIMALRTERDALTVALQHTETLSLTDELTGLPNRRAFVQRLEHELSRCRRTGQPLAMVLLDIDNFKGVNDRYGHYVGDMMLRCYAQRMVPELRQHDLLARYGGEEFVLLLPETTLNEAHHALGKLRRRIHCESLDAGGPCIALPTFSAGVACLRPGEPATALINRADQCLYRAKNLGRNRVECDQPLTPDEK